MFGFGSKTEIKNEEERQAKALGSTKEELKQSKEINSSVEKQGKQAADNDLKYKQLSLENKKLLDEINNEISGNSSLSKYDELMLRSKAQQLRSNDQLYSKISGANAANTELLKEKATSIQLNNPAKKLAEFGSSTKDLMLSSAETAGKLYGIFGGIYELFASRLRKWLSKPENNPANKPTENTLSAKIMHLLKVGRFKIGQMLLGIFDGLYQGGTFDNELPDELQNQINSAPKNIPKLNEKTNDSKPKKEKSLSELIQEEYNKAPEWKSDTNHAIADIWNMMFEKKYRTKDYKKSSTIESNWKAKDFIDKGVFKVDNSNNLILDEKGLPKIFGTTFSKDKIPENEKEHFDKYLDLLRQEYEEKVPLKTAVKQTTKKLDLPDNLSIVKPKKTTFLPNKNQQQNQDYNTKLNTVSVSDTGSSVVSNQGTKQEESIEIPKVSSVSKSPITFTVNENRTNIVNQNKYNMANSTNVTFNQGDINVLNPIVPKLTDLPTGGLQDKQELQESPMLETTTIDTNSESVKTYTNDKPKTPEILFNKNVFDNMKGPSVNIKMNTTTNTETIQEVKPFVVERPYIDPNALNNYNMDFFSKDEFNRFGVDNLIS